MPSAQGTAHKAAPGIRGTACDSHQTLAEARSFSKPHEEPICLAGKILILEFCFWITGFSA